MDLGPLGKDLDNIYSEIIMLMSSRNQMLAISWLWGKYMPCLCQCVSISMVICYEPIFLMFVYTAFGFEEF